MSDAKTIQLYDALKRISNYERPARLRKNAEREYGLSGDEAIEMAYDNVLSEAKHAIRGMRRPSATKQPEVARIPQASGTVLWFNAAKGFGYIKPDEGEEIFAHFSQIPGGDMREGQRVRFGVSRGPKGRQATNIELIPVSMQSTRTPTAAHTLEPHD